MLEFHPLANLFPMLDGDDREDLAWDVNEHGLREKIVLHDGMILDGRNRYRACLDAKLFKPDDEIVGGSLLFIKYFAKFLPDREGDPLAFVISKNLRRRQLNESQRATVAAKIANLGHGGDRRTDQAANLPLEPATPQVSQAAAAKLLNVSERSVRTAKRVIEQGTPELLGKVEQGDITIAAAAEVARQPADVQRRTVEIGGPEFMAEVRRMREQRTAEKKARRQEVERRLGERQQALPTRKYGVIYADPEWRFEPWSRETGMDRAPENHYPTSDTIDIISRPVAQIAADDSVLFLWVTGPCLLAGIEVMKHWGFDYKTNFAWGKDKIGPGYWNREKHELLLVGTRGDIPCPAMGTQWDSFQLAPRGRHSEKPDLFAEMIEAYFPNLPKIELNRRGSPRPGWDAWGNEAEEADQTHREPSNRDVGTDGEASSAAALQGQAAHAGTGSETLASHEGDTQGEGASALSPPDLDQGGDIDLPPWLNRANWVGGHPPAPSAHSIMSIEEARP